MLYDLGPRARHVYGVLLEQIRSGALAPGTRLPPHTQLAETFQVAGIAAEALDGTTPLATRRAILQRLHTGTTRVVANCAVLTEGFDEDVSEVLVCYSLGVYETQSNPQATRVIA